MLPPHTFLCGVPLAVTYILSHFIVTHVEPGMMLDRHVAFHAIFRALLDELWLGVNRFYFSGAGGRAGKKVIN